MKVAVISDIHGNYQALEAVLEDIERQQVREIVSLGDNIGYGPEPDRVVATLADRGIASVMGNHELALLDPGYFRQLNFLAQESLTLNRKALKAGNLAWLSELPRCLVKHGARFVHGCPPDSPTRYLFSPKPSELKEIFAAFQEPLGFAGHTHTIAHYSCDLEPRCCSHRIEPGAAPLAPERRHLIVAGSVGQPRDRFDRKAKYAIWNQATAELEIRALDYDAAATVALMEAHGYPVANATRLLS